MNYLLLMMGGKGTRFGEDVPKQFFELEGKPLFEYILEDLISIDEIDKIIILTNPNFHEYTVKHLPNSDKIMSVLDGGNGRSKDILTCLNSIKDEATSADSVLIYDATHPFVDEKGIKDVSQKLKEGHKAVTLAEYQYDTTYRIDPETNIVTEVTPRKEMVAGASPEGFNFKMLYEIFSSSTNEELAQMTSAGAIALKYGIDLLAVKTEVINLKITYPNDIMVIRKLINSYGKIK